MTRKIWSYDIPIKELISKGARLIRESQKKILVFTGAGLSTECDVLNFRSPGGV